MKEPCWMYMHTKFQVDIFKMTEFWYFEGRKRPFSRCSLGFLHFSDFEISCGSVRSKSVLLSFFRVLDEKLT